MEILIARMCGSKKSVAYFAHDPAHRLLPAAGDSTDGGDGEYTCGGCLVAGAGPRYRCAHPGCGFTIHEACALRFPRTLRSAVHPRHRLRRREAEPAAANSGHGNGGGECEVCGECVKGACYACAACGVAVHPLCARMPASATGPAHPGDGHEAWLVRVASSPPAATEPEPDGDGEQKQGKQDSAAAGCGACRRPLGAWRYRCVTCAVELHPRCLVPAADQCRGDGGRVESVARSCYCGLVHDLTRCMATLGTALHYRGYYNG